MPKHTRVKFGRYYRFTGSKPAWMQGRSLLLVAIQKDGACDDTDSARITDPRTLDRLGGVESRDTAFVHAWMPSRGRPSVIEDQVEWGDLAWLPDQDQPVEGKITVIIDDITAVSTPRAPRKLRQV